MVHPEGTPGIGPTEFEWDREIENTETRELILILISYRVFGDPLSMLSPRALVTNYRK